LSASHRAVESLWLAARSLLWTLLLPGLFAGFLPWRYFGLSQVVIDPSRPRHVIGLAAIAIGVVLLGACIWEFARRGRGTLAPVDPPTELVVQGLYRYVRNPMYLSVTVIVLGPFRDRLRGAHVAAELRAGVRALPGEGGPLGTSQARVRRGSPGAAS
jgi:protein-S-isoprenylcysteine O-methyltransferase Ste14